MPQGWWEHVRDEYLLRCHMEGKKSDPEWLRTWERGGVLW